MKFLKIAVAVACASVFGNAYAFHDGGVATCDGCHTMHNSLGNAPMGGRGGAGLLATNPKYAGKGPQTQFQGVAYLLQGTDQSSTCLNCHSGSTIGSYKVMTYPAPTSGVPVQMTPGGDFAWLGISMAANSGAHLVGVAGERHGHSILAADFGLTTPDSVLTAAPGGTYSASALSCVSCHDPHSRSRIVVSGGTEQSQTPVMSQLGVAVDPIVGSGSTGTAASTGAAVGVYRLLASANYSQMSYDNSATPFNAPPPVAVAPSSYNRTEAASDTHVAYGTGMSEWCANCHRAIHNNNVNTANTAFIHPAGSSAVLTALANDLAGNATGTTIADIYNAYVKSGALNGSVTTSYSSLVPYEEGTATRATLVTRLTQISGPSSASGSTANVMCLSCHRAHASGFQSMTRWDNTVEYITEDSAYLATDAAGGNNGVMTTAQYTAAMYGRPATAFATFQRSLCNKCHAKD